jgi:hypothetical protein
MSLHIFASKELSNPPEKATARLVSFPIAYCTAAKSAFIRSSNRTTLASDIVLFYKKPYGTEG